MGKASGGQGATRGREASGQEPREWGEAGTFPEGSRRFASGREQSHNEASEVTEKRDFLWDSEGMEFMQEVTGDGGKARQRPKDLPEIPERPSGEDSFANLFIWCLPLLWISLFNELIDDTDWEWHHWDWISCLLMCSSHNGHGLIHIQARTNPGGHPSPSKPRHKARKREIFSLPPPPPFPSALQKDLKALFLHSVGMGW